MNAQTFYNGINKIQAYKVQVSEHVETATMIKVAPGTSKPTVPGCTVLFFKIYFCISFEGQRCKFKISFKSVKQF